MADPAIKWRVPNPWTIVQSNGLLLTLDVSQDGNTLIGTATSPGRASDATTGVVNGSIDADQFFITIFWQDKSVGKYLGTVSEEGMVEGMIVDPENRSEISHWRSDTALTVWE